VTAVALVVGPVVVEVVAPEKSRYNADAAFNAAVAATKAGALTGANLLGFPPVMSPTAIAI